MSSVDCRRIAEAAWAGEIESLVEFIHQQLNRNLVPVCDLWIVRELPSDLADVVYSASMGRDVRLTRFEPGNVLAFSCDDPDESARIDGERWALFDSADGSTVVVTAGRGVTRYREGSAVAN